MIPYEIKIRKTFNFLIESYSVKPLQNRQFIISINNLRKNTEDTYYYITLLN